ncbi:MAG: AAA family ATPase [Bacteroidota bacterium]
MIDKAPLELSEDFKYALDLMDKSPHHLFITGRAGTGKSTLLQLFRNTTRKKIVVLAPTGIAALNVQGQTIHSFFGFPPRLLNRQEIRRRRNRKLYQRIETLVIDEISMVRADMLDNIDYFLRLNRDNNQPFGGVQVLFFGDLFQLPPVVSKPVEQQLFQTTYDSPYFFSAHVFRDNFVMETVELQKTYRQTARHFIRLLDAVRINQADEDDLVDLNERHQPDFELEDYYITLSARNATVNSINSRKLAQLPGPEITFTATIGGSFQPHLYPTKEILGLRLGSQVMFIKNDPERKFVNGTIGKVTKLHPDGIEVRVREGGQERVIEVAKLEWEVLKYKAEPNDKGEIETEILGTFKQYPLRLAWAITIHKSQGKTFDRVIIDLGSGAFAHGQTYVALSRCRTLEGIVLKQKLRPRDIQVDERIVEFYESSR